MGGQQFNGKGKTRQAAKHDAAAKALRILQNEPPPERLEVRGAELGLLDTGCFRGVGKTSSCIF